MSVRTIFGELIMKGNARYFQNLTVQGSFANFLGNLTAASSTVSLGSFNSVFLGSMNSVSINTQSFSAGGSVVTVTNNVVVGNALTTSNVTASSANVAGTLNATSIVSSSNLPAVRGNGYASNALSTTNLFATSANVATLNVYYISTNRIGIATVTPAANAMDVRGNAYISNAFSATNVFAQTVNISTLNATTFSILGISSALTNLYSLGNLYVTNTASTRNVFTASLNVATLNALNMNISSTSNVSNLSGPRINLVTLNTSSVSGFVGINTSTGIGATLQVNGNIYCSNAITAQSIITGNVNGADQNAPFLLPTQANAGTIQAWISGTCNNSYKYGTSALQYSNVNNGPQRNNDYSGSVLLPDGRVMFVPFSASNIGVYDPSMLLFSTYLVPGLSSDTAKFKGGVLLPSGNVVFVPWGSSNIGMFNPIDFSFSNISSGQSATNPYSGGVLSPTGNVVFIPKNSSNIGVFSPTTFVTTNVGPVAGTNLNLFGSGLLLPNGNVVMSPMTSANIGMYNTASLSSTGFSNVGPFKSSGPQYETSLLGPDGNVFFLPATSAVNVVVYNPTSVSTPVLSNIQLGQFEGTISFRGGCLAPSGNIICAPMDASNIGMIDPVSLTYSNCAFVSTLASKFMDCTLHPTGRFIFSPYNAGNVGVLNTTVPSIVEFCLNPFLNKY